MKLKIATMLWLCCVEPPVCVLMRHTDLTSLHHSFRFYITVLTCAGLVLFLTQLLEVLVLSGSPYTLVLAMTWSGFRWSWLHHWLKVSGSKSYLYSEISIDSSCLCNLELNFMFPCCTDWWSPCDRGTQISREATVYLHIVLVWESDLQLQNTVWLKL